MAKENREIPPPENDESAAPATATPTDSKKFVSLAIMFISFITDVVVIFILIQFRFDILWLIIFLAIEILLFPVIWTYIVSPHLTSEDGTLYAIDQVMNRSNILGGLVKKMPKNDGDSR